MKRTLQIIFLVLFSTSLFAQEYNFRHFTTDQGLIQSNVNDVIQDSKGYIWVATNGGLSRFDGKTFTNFTAQNGLESNKCVNLFTDSKGRIWVSHLYGLSLIEGKSIKTFNDSDGVKIRNIAAFVEVNGQICIGGNGGLMRYDVVMFQHISIKDHDRFPIKTLAGDANGNIWVGYADGGGLVLGKGNSFNEFLPKVFNSIGHLSFKENKMLIYADDGIYSFQNEKLNQERFGNDYWGVEDVATSSKGSQWLATANGLAVLEKGTITHLNESNGIPATEMSSVLCDREGNIWAGSRKGLFLLTSRTFSHFGKNQNLINFAPTAMVENKSDGKLWFNSEPSGLFVYVNGIITKVSVPKTLDEHFFSCLTLDSKQNLWMGTADFSGIFQLSGNTIKQFTSDNGLCDNNIQCLVTSTDDNVWAGTSKGICKYDGKQWHSIGDPVGSFTFDVKALHFSENGRLWIGTADGKIYSYRNDTYTLLDSLEGKIHSAVNSISSKGDALYFSTEADGLIILSGDKVSFANKESGLYTNDFRFAAIGQNQQLYCGTQKGLMVLSLDDKNKILSQKMLGIAEGFTGGECLPGSVLISRSGQVWLGNPRGVSVLNPNEAIVNKTPPCIDISDILLNFKVPEWTKYTNEISPLSGFGVNPEFSYQENYVLFKLKGLSFASPTGLRFKWVLDGFEKEWNPPTSNSEVSYSNLPAGQYTFRVKAISAAGIESAETTYSFTITPPIWQTVWFYAFILILVVAGAYTYIKYRERSLVAEKAALEVAVKQRTIELEEQKNIVEQKNIDIMNSIEYAHNIQLAILPGQDEISKSFSEHFIVYKPQNIVSGDLYWYYRMKNVVWAAAIDCTGHGVPGAFMSMMANDLLNQAIIEKRITDPADVLADVNRSIRLVFKEENQVVETQQGMDVALLCLNLDSGLVKFSGAMRPIISIIENELKEWDGDKASIGRYTDESFRFNTTEFRINKNDSLLLFSDGYCDQFGGAKGRKLMTARFKQTIENNKKKTLAEMGQALKSDLEQWQGNLEQVDDILVWGIRL